MAFSLITGFVEWLRHREPVKILILGLDGAGKTSVLYCLQDAVGGGPPATRPPPQPTVGLNLGAVELGGRRLTLWDVGGAVNLRRLWPDYYQEAQAVAFVVDAGDRTRWGEATQTLQTVLGSEELQGKPLLVLAHGASSGESSGAVDDLAAQLGVERLQASGDRPCRLEAVAPPHPGAMVQAFDWLAKTASSM